MSALPDTITHVVIDEVQKVPRLLDIVHRLMKKKEKPYFIMTASSARKLKAGGANLLAGRAFVYHLFSLTFFELTDQFNLDEALRWGTLPQIFACHTDLEKQEFLHAFEHFIILECQRLSEYYRLEYRFTYLRTINDVEIDLIVERPGKSLLCIEIKSATNINPEDISLFAKISKDIPESEAVVFCNEKYAKKIDDVMVLPWQQGLKQYFQVTTSRS